MSISTSDFSSDFWLEQVIDLSSLPRRRQLNRHPFIERLRLAVPFDYIAVTGLDLEDYRVGSGHSIDTDIPPAFFDAYYEEGMVQSDPFVAASRVARDVVVEEDVYAITPPSQRLRYLERTFGVHNRTLFPLLRGDVVYGAVTFCRSKPFDADEIAFLAGVAEATHTMLTRPILQKFFAESLKLSDGEVLCLKLASLGMTSEEVSRQSSYAVDTVNTYLKTAIRKLGASNRLHAVAEALRRRLIE